MHRNVVEIDAALGATPPFDTIIDVRSPSEFAEDHMPDAVNLPVLDDVERARVGTLHRGSTFDARRIGAALVARRCWSNRLLPLPVVPQITRQSKRVWSASRSCRTDRRYER